MIEERLKWILGDEKMNNVLKDLQDWDKDKLMLLKDLILMKLKSLKEMIE